MIKSVKFNAKTISIVLAILFILPILLIPAFGPIDDWRILSFQNQSFVDVIVNNYNSFVVSKRFVPFGIIDQYLIYNISTSAGFFYFVLFVLALLGVLALYKLADLIVFGSKIAYMFLPFIFLSISFTDSFYRLAPAEKYLIFLMPLSLYLIIKLFKSGKSKFLFLSLFVVNLAIYQKEIIFVIYALFSIVFLIMFEFNTTYKAVLGNKKYFRWFNIGNLLSILLYLIIYYVFIYSKTISTGFGGFFELNIIEKLTVGIGFYTDYIFKVPLVTIFLPLSLLVRLILSRRIKTHFESKDNLYLIPFYDSLLVASWLYALFVCLSGQGAYGRYMLPTVLFSFFPVIEYMIVFFKSVRNKFIIYGLSIMLFFSILNSSIRGIDWAIWFKIDEFSFQQSLIEIKKIANNRPVNVYLADKASFDNAEFYMAYNWFLKKRYNLNRSNFDLHSISMSQRDIALDWWDHSPTIGNKIINTNSYDLADCSALQSLQLRKPQKGDLVIISSNNLHYELIESRLNKMNIKMIKMENIKQREINFPNPISYSLIRGKKKLFRNYSLYNHLYIVE